MPKLLKEYSTTVRRFNIMPSKDKHTHRIPNSARLPKVKTVNDLLTRDDINGILADLDQEKPNISDLIVIYMDRRDHKYHWTITDGTLVSTATWMLESTKLDLLIEDTEEG
jgi:hypothetical protein